MQHTLSGNFRFHRNVASRFLPEGRDVIVFLPPRYNEKTARFPVLYLHDGQNLFDAATAFCHQEWQLDENANELIEARVIAPLIIVGIYNAGEKRLADYTPVRDHRQQGGRARQHARFVVEELIPFIDSEYRTRPGSANRGLGGSSLGGLVTLYIALHYPDVFGKLVVMSPSVWWARRAILRELKKAVIRQRPQVWLDVGTAEGMDAEGCVQNVRDLRDVLLSRGWQLGVDLAYLEDDGAGHNEKAWGARMRHALQYLFPPATNKREICR